MKTKHPNKIVIFDIDGTLADIEHRRGYVRGPRSDQNWGAFNKTMHLDGVNEIVVDTYNALSATGKYHMVIFTGRGDDFKQVTVDWLADNDIAYDELHMRSDVHEKGVKDSIVKKGMLDRLTEAHPDKTVSGVFDDRLQVVEMWQENGIFVFDVGQGEGDF